MRIDEIVVADLQVDGQARFPNESCVPNRTIGGIVRGEKIGIARRADQSRRSARRVVDLVASANLRVVQSRLSMGFITATAANFSGCAKAIFNAP